MLIPRREPWRFQPGIITAANPLWFPSGRGALFARGEPFELLNQVTFLKHGTPTIATGFSGVGSAGITTAATYDGWYAPDLASGSRSDKLYDPIAPPLTLFMVGKGTAGNQYAFGRSNGSGIPSFVVGFYNGSAKGGIARVRTTGGNIDFTPTANVFDPSSDSFCVLSVGTATTWLYAGRLRVGIEDARSLATPSGNFYYEYADAYRCLSYGGMYNGVSPFCALAGMAIGQAWERSQVIAFFENPWQVCAERESMIFLPDVGGVTMPTLSAPSFAGRVPSVTITH